MIAWPRWVDSASTSGAGLALCMVGWLAMNLGEGSFFRDEVLAAAWRGAAADRSVDGRWLLRVVLEAFASTLPSGVPD
jgi:hypothetical protein